MKINLIFFISNFSFGGAGNSIVRLCQSLNKNKYSINVICLGKSGYKKNLIKNNINLIEINKSKLLFSIFNLIQIINNLISERKKNILISNIHYNNVVILFLKRFFKPVKIIIVERTPIEELDIFFGSIDLIKKKIIKVLVKLFYKKADIIIANSSGIKKGLDKLVNKTIKVIYPPSIIGRKKRIKKLNLKNLKLFCFTRLSNEKNIIVLFKALRNLNKNIILNIYGNGVEEKLLKDYVNKNNLNKIIFFKGHKNNMNNIKEQVYISTSLFEGCCNSTIEAINNSKIILSSNCPGGNLEILLNGRGGKLFQSNNYMSLSNSIGYIIKNPKKYYNKTKIAHKHLDRFYLKENIRRYQKIFNSL